MSMKVSDDAISKATGNNWEFWRRLLKKHFSLDSEHKEIVSFLREEYNVSHWWAQEITVDFEQMIGKRKIGQTLNTDYQIGVRKTISGSPRQVWEYLMSPAGLSVWLGEVTMNTIEKGEQYVTAEGVSGEIRVVNPYHHIRLTWQKREWKSPSTLQIRVIPTSQGKTTVAVHHEKLKDDKIREQMRAHWQQVLASIQL